MLLETHLEPKPKNLNNGSPLASLTIQNTRFITWRTILGSACSLLHWFMSVSEKTAFLLLIKE